MGRSLVKLLLNTAHLNLMGNQMETTWLNILSEPFPWIQTPPGQGPTLKDYEYAGLRWGHEKSFEWELLETLKASLTPWGGALSWMGAVLQDLVPCPWRRGGGRWVLGENYLVTLFLWRLWSQNSAKIPAVLSSFHSLPSLGPHVFTKWLALWSPMCR